MADKVSITNLPDSGSPEAVALELWKILGNRYKVERNLKADLDFFVTCLNAVKGYNYNLGALG